MTGKEIQIKREALGLTQPQLAKLIGVHKNTIVNYEGGGTIPESKVPILEMVLNAVKEERTAQNETKKDPPQSMEDLLATSVLEKLMPIINKVLESHQKIIKELLQQGLEIDQLMDDVEEIKETTNTILKEVKELH